MGFNLTGNEIKNTYQRLVTISGSVIANGTGSDIANLTVTASNATSASYAFTASYAINAGVALNTGSLLVTASISNATTTFTKGDGSTFALTANNVVNATSASLATTASHAVESETVYTTQTNANQDHYIAFVATTNAYEGLETDNQLVYNPNSNLLTVTASLALNAQNATSSSFATSASFAATAASSTTSTTASYAANADLLDGQTGTYYQNANNINAGTLSANRLSGTYTIDISGSAQTANTANSATSASYAATASIAQTAVSVTSASYASFAENANNLDGNDGTYYRNADNINAGTLPVGRLSGSYNISITGNAATATSATSASFATTAATAVSSSYVQNADQLDGQDGTYYRNADNLNAGTVNANRLSGTYNIDISGSAQTAQNAQTAVSASFATTSVTSSIATSASFATTASYALNAGVTVSTGSLLVTASAANNVITFTKGDASTFAVTVDTGSAAPPFPYTGSAQITGSLGVTGSITVLNGDYNIISGSLSGSAINNLGDVYTGSSRVEHVVTLTQAEYNSISASFDPNTFYIISDSTPTSLANYAVLSGSNNFTGSNTFTGLINATGSSVFTGTQTVVGTQITSGSTQITGSLGVTGSIVLSDPSQTFLRGNNDFNIGNATATQAIRLVGSETIFANNNNRFDSANFEVNSSTIRFGDSLSDNITISGSLKTTGSVNFSNGYITLTQVSQSLNYVDDTAAAAGGVPLGGLYRNGNAIMIRLA